MHKALMIAALLPLSACGNFVENEEMANKMAASKNNSAEGAVVVPEDNAVDVTNATDNAVANSTAPSGARSAYTEVTDKSCKTIRVIEPPEGEESIQRCTGYGGVPLFVKEGDLRMSIDAGVESDDFATMNPFNVLGGPIEWRVGADGRPYAIIYRLRATDPELDNKSTEIFVKSVGTAAKPGCTIAKIPGNQANANEQARAKADAVPGGTPCLAD